MRIDMDVSDNYFKCFDESRGIVINKSKILKLKKNQSLSYMKTKVIEFLVLLVVGLVLVLFSLLFKKLFIVSMFVVILSFIYILFSFIETYFSYKYRRSKNFFKSIIINEDGIIDESYYGIKMIFNWDKIKGIVLGTYSITILTDTPYYFTFSIDSKKAIIRALVEYGYEDKIIV